MAPAIGGTGGKRRGAIEGDGAASSVLGHRVENKEERSEGGRENS